jgi:polyhydroxyalkanoate synthesis repressor PhaR
MNDVRTIKRYQNRKLYDTFQSCYVTLEEIAQIMRDGNEIQVIDNKTKNDITYNTMTQLLFDQERKSTRPTDVDLMKRVIRSTEGTFTGYIRGLESQLTQTASPSSSEHVASESFNTTAPSETQESVPSAFDNTLN